MEKVQFGTVPQYKQKWVAGMACKKQGFYYHNGSTFVALVAGVLAEPVATYNETTGDFDVTANWGLVAYGSELTGIKADISQLKLDVESMILTGNDYMAAGFNPANLAAAASKKLGDNSLIKYGFYLIDTTDNSGEVCKHPMLLKRNNLLRFDNGNFAPVVGITAAMRAECMEHALYDAGGNLVYAAGAYDPEDFYANHVTIGIIDGVKKFVFDKLTKDDTGVEVSHYLMPWETTETKYTIGFGCGNTLYFLQNAHGASGLRWNIMSPIAKVFDGCTPQVLKPTLFSPCPTGLISEDGVIKTRTFFTLYGGMSSGSAHCEGTAANGCTLFARADRTYPAHRGIQQPLNMQWARNNNSDHSKSLPFAEGGWNTLNAFLTYLEIKYGTRDIHGAGLFGSGISSDESDNNEATFHSHGGCRIRKQGSDVWTYANWNVTPAGVYTSAEKASTNMSNLLNAYAPKETVLESQMAFSFAMEMGVEADEQFEMYGLSYWYEAVPGADLADMSAKVWSQRAGTVNGYDADGIATVFEVEANLRMSLFEGVNLSGDIYWYFGGGVEVVGTNLTAGSGGKSGDLMDVYVEPDQENWHSETTVSLSPGKRFAFEDTMRHVAQFNSLGNFYSKDDVPGLPCGIVSGGGLDSGMCHYNYNGNYWGYSTVGQRARLGLRFRGTAHFTYCSPRLWYGNYAAGSTAEHFGGSAQVRIAEQGATPTQSE